MRRIPQLGACVPDSPGADGARRTRRPGGNAADAAEETQCGGRGAGMNGASMQRGAADTADGRQCGGCSGRDTMRRTGRGNERSVERRYNGARRTRRTGGNAADAADGRQCDGRCIRPQRCEAGVSLRRGGEELRRRRRAGQRTNGPTDGRTAGCTDMRASSSTCGRAGRPGRGGRGGTRGVTIPVCRPAASHRVRCGSGSGGRCGRRSPPRRRRP